MESVTDVTVKSSTKGRVITLLRLLPHDTDDLSRIYFISGVLYPFMYFLNLGKDQRLSMTKHILISMWTPFSVDIPGTEIFVRTLPSDDQAETILRSLQGCMQHEVVFERMGVRCSLIKLPRYPRCSSPCLRSVRLISVQFLPSTVYVANFTRTSLGLFTFCLPVLTSIYLRQRYFCFKDITYRSITILSVVDSCDLLATSEMRRKFRVEYCSSALCCLSSSLTQISRSTLAFLRTVFSSSSCFIRNCRPVTVDHYINNFCNCCLHGTLNVWLNNVR